MPIYEYKRPDGSTFEVTQSFSEDPLTHDPETGVEVQRVLHAPAVHFKGSGFYNTDYGTRRRQRENASSSESSSGGETGASTEKKGSSESSASTKPEPASDKSSAKTEPKSGSKVSSAVGTS
jgi:putative FmdB family regulatory protein